MKINGIIDFQSQNILKNTFKQSPLNYYTKLTLSFLKSKNIAAKYDCIFASTYVCEQAVSYMKKN